MTEDQKAENRQPVGRKGLQPPAEVYGSLLWYAQAFFAAVYLIRIVHIVLTSAPGIHPTPFLLAHFPPLLLLLLAHILLRKKQLGQATALMMLVVIQIPWSAALTDPGYTLENNVLFAYAVFAVFISTLFFRPGFTALLCGAQLVFVAAYYWRHDALRTDGYLLVLGFLLLVSGIAVVMSAIQSRVVRRMELLRSTCEEGEKKVSETHGLLLAQKERLNQLAYYDELTGLCNQRKLNEDIAASLEERRRFILLALDVDDFREFNEYYGHRRADACLQRIAGGLARHAAVRSAYRRNGDEFVVFLDDGPQGDVSRTARDLLSMVSQESGGEGRRASVSVSAGVVRIPEDAATPDEVFRIADMTLGRAKREKNRNSLVFYDSSIRKELIRVRRTEDLITDALKEDRFFMQFQPVVEIGSGTAVACEALLRWNPGELGESLDISTQELIRTAEERGHIIRLDQWVIRHVFARLGEDPDAFGGRRVYINLSAQTFCSRPFLRFVDETLQATGADPGLLGFEITEHTMIQNWESAEKAALAIREQGFSLLLDDFGTMYSSLNYLYALPFDGFKIDMTYVSGMLDSREDQAIIRHLMNLSVDLDVVPVLEGIETTEQEETLEKLGCRYGQGYLYGKALSYQAYRERWVKR